FSRFLKRLLLFLAKMKDNKFVRIGQRTRIDLYCPGFPSRGFDTACRKFLVFDQKMPCTTVLISVTSACPYHCRHCYQKYDRGQDVDLHALVNTVKKLQDLGITFFNIEGGEPFLRYERLKKVCAAIDDRSEIWINSTGYGITRERLQELKKLNVHAIMFSLHSPVPEEFNQFMGDDGAWEKMIRAVSLCHETGIAVAFNACLEKKDFYNGNFQEIMELTREFQAALIQLIKPKPAGGWLKPGVKPFLDTDLAQVKKLVHRYNLEPEFKDYPAISAQVIEEAPERFGCTAGGTDRFYINAKGDLQPCEFLNLSFGNIATDDFSIIYDKMRSCFEEPGDCWLCEKYSGEILNVFQDHHLKSLPLPGDLSATIYSKWHRGNKTELYK
ncbi:MAG: radical SAM protein, partial [Heliobacteriaceae bacterium]|nr:radical SAM protein [Heliobacteriaceae bacterium]